MQTEKIRDMMAVNPEKGKIPCAVAHYIAAYLSCNPLEVGKRATEAGIKIYECQLGLFGYGRKGKSEYKITGRKVEVEPEVIEMIKTSAENGRISCIRLWQIADSEGIIRAEAGNAADALGLKISPCQLGAF